MCVHPTEVLQCFLATREAMQLQQNETVYESSGTSTLPSSTESPGTPDREPPQRPWEHHNSTSQGLSFPAACHLLVSRCLFLLLGVRAAWQEESVSSQTHAESDTDRSVFVRVFLCIWNNRTCHKYWQLHVIFLSDVSLSPQVSTLLWGTWHKDGVVVPFWEKIWWKRGSYMFTSSGKTLYRSFLLVAIVWLIIDVFCLF